MTYRPRRGYVVTELELAELEEVYRLRRLLETRCAPPGRRRATPADLRALEAAADDCAAAAATGDVAGQLAANRRFHDRLHALAGEPPGGAADRPPLGLDRGLPGALLRPPGRGRRADSAHRAIIAAVASGRRDAVVRAPGRAPRAARSSGCADARSARPARRLSPARRRAQARRARGRSVDGADGLRHVQRRRRGRRLHGGRAEAVMAARADACR